MRTKPRPQLESPRHRPECRGVLSRVCEGEGCQVVVFYCDCEPDPQRRCFECSLPAPVVATVHYSPAEGQSIDLTPAVRAIGERVRGRYEVHAIEGRAEGYYVFDRLTVAPATPTGAPYASVWKAMAAASRLYSEWCQRLARGDLDAATLDAAIGLVNKRVRGVEGC